MANRFAVLVSTLIAVVSTSVCAQDSVKVPSAVRMVNGTQQVVLENRHVRLTFDLARGGRCIKFLFKDKGEQIIGNEDVLFPNCPFLGFKLSPNICLFMVIGTEDLLFQNVLPRPS